MKYQCISSIFTLRGTHSSILLFSYHLATATVRREQANEILVLWRWLREKEWSLSHFWTSFTVTLKEKENLPSFPFFSSFNALPGRQSQQLHSNTIRKLLELLFTNPCACNPQLLLSDIFIFYFIFLFSTLPQLLRPKDSVIFSLKNSDKWSRCSTSYIIQSLLPLSFCLLEISEQINSKKSKTFHIYT